MWCDNCLLLLPLRAGAMAWALILGLYSIVGGILLLMYGQFIYFIYPEWYIYGGISLAIAAVAVVNIIAFSNRSYIWARVCSFLWLMMLVVSGIRGFAMLLQLHRGQDKITWECDNDGQLWGMTAEEAAVATKTIPDCLCRPSFSTVLTAFIIGIIIDILFQLYMCFLNWRYVKRLEHYRAMEGPSMGGYYKA